MSVFFETLKKLSPELNQKQLDAMQGYYDLLSLNNAEFNLTAISGEKEAAFKHFYDSIFCADLIPFGADVLDVGAGAGFPGMPLKIARPDIRITLLDSSAKKSKFIEKAACELGVDAAVVCARAEQAAEKMRETFDVCVSRAVATLGMLCELCLPFVRPAGIFLAYKGGFEEELLEAKNALALLGGSLEQVVRGGGGDNHNVLVIKKTGQTPGKYPRRFARILKNPL